MLRLWFAGVNHARLPDFKHQHRVKGARVTIFMAQVILVVNMHQLEMSCTGSVDLDHYSYATHFGSQQYQACSMDVSKGRERVVLVAMPEYRAHAVSAGWLNGERTACRGDGEELVGQCRGDRGGEASPSRSRWRASRPRNVQATMEDEKGRAIRERTTGIVEHLFLVLLRSTSDVYDAGLPVSHISGPLSWPQVVEMCGLRCQVHPFDSSARMLRDTAAVKNEREMDL